VSEQILNGTSAQLGYTVPFTLFHTGKNIREDKLKTDTLQKPNTTQKKQTMQNKAEQTKLPWFSCLIQHSARKRGGGGLTLQSSRAHTGLSKSSENNTGKNNR